MKMEEKKMKAKKLLALLLAAVMMLSIVGCNGNAEPTDPVVDNKTYTYNEYVAVSPSNWNELTYQDNNDTAIMNRIGSSFFGFDYKFDANGEIVPGEFVITYEAATKLEDVSASVDAKWNVPEGGKGYAYKITLRNDLKWEDGTPIKAEDFVYTMQQQLDPLFQNYRADSFYVGATILVNAQGYAKQGQSLETVDNGAAGIYTIADLVKGEDGVYTQPDGAPIYFAMTEALDWCSGASVTDYAAYMDAASFAALQALADENGRVALAFQCCLMFVKLLVFYKSKIVSINIKTHRADIVIV